MADTRIEQKSRYHKRWQGAAELLLSEAPNYRTVQNKRGRIPRADFRGFPRAAGLGYEVALVVFDNT